VLLKAEVKRTPCLKKTTLMLHTITSMHILVIFGSDVAERVCHRMVICYPTSLNYVSALPGKC